MGRLRRVMRVLIPFYKGHVFQPVNEIETIRKMQVLIPFYKGHVFQRRFYRWLWDYN